MRGAGCLTACARPRSFPDERVGGQGDTCAMALVCCGSTFDLRKGLSNPSTSDGRIPHNGREYV
jgi:hypothetical protein